MAIDRMWQVIRLRLRSLLSGESVDRELDEELQFHIDRQTELNIGNGMTRDEARLAALRSFGGAEQRKEECRDTRRVSWLLDAVRDGRHALRLLARSPVFAIAAVLSLGIGIGSNVAMFSVVDALLLKKLPVPQPDGLVYFQIMTEPPYRRDDVPYRMYERLRESSTSFASMAGVWPMERANLTVDAPAGDNPTAPMTRVGLVTSGYFETLGVNAAIGRVLGASDQTERPVAVVSDAFWRSRMNADRDLRAHTVHLNGSAFDVVGVTPPGFSGELVGTPADLWVPFTLVKQVVPEITSGTGGFVVRIIARLASDVPATQAAAATLPVLRQAEFEEAAKFNVKLSESVLGKIELDLPDMSRGISPQRRSFRASLLTLMAFVGLLVVVGCANVANLLLARSSVRQRELAVRLAVGAGRGRIARQMLAESAMIAALGGLSGLALAMWATSLLSSLLAVAPATLNTQTTGIVLDLRIDPRVLLFATTLCGITAALSGLVPAIAAQRVAPASALRAARTLGLGRFAGPSSALLIAQVAVSLVLLIGAGLFIRSLHNLRAQDLGLARDNQLLAWIVPGQTGRKDDAMVDLWHTMMERLSAIPGVAAVGASNQAVLNGGDVGMGVPSVAIIIPGEPRQLTTKSAGRSFVTPGFFAASGIRVVAGREFTGRDAGEQSSVVMMNASMARFYFGSETAAVGRIVQFPGPSKQPHEIVGVINDYVRTTPRHTLDYFSTYYPYRHADAINRGQSSRLRVMLVAIRTSVPPLTIADDVRREIRAIDPLLPVLSINTPDQQLEGLLAQDRIVASLSTALGATAMVLASLGMFGLLSYRVARRTNEIGVRLAFGATRASVLALVLRESSRLVIAGVIAGAIAAVSLSRLVASRLYGVSASDPWIIAGAAALLTLVACIAAVIPARQASVVDPATALRCD
ncbi:MAG: ABC transporter permease [Cyanobacteria bacterium]|nr:ABC transporter permease [Cyanobacteriota bacterium]